MTPLPTEHSQSQQSDQTGRFLTGFIENLSHCFKMPAVKRSAPEATRSRRQSGRLSITAQKSSYFEGTEDESEDELSRPVKRGRRSKQVPVKDDPEDQYEDEEEDVDNDGLVEDEEDSELDEDVRPKVQIIPIDEMRDQGGVDYDDHKLHKNTMLFLRDLKANNKRVWLKCE